MVHGTIPRGVSVARGGWAYWGTYLEGWGPLEFFMLIEYIAVCISPSWSNFVCK